MSLELCVLASGSAGNASLLRTPAGCLLIDAGLGPRTLSRRMDGTGCALNDLGAIVLTHLDRDHFSFGWIATLLRRGIPLFVHSSRREEVLSFCGDLEPVVRTFDSRPFSPLKGLAFLPLRLAHDAAGSHGFVIAGFGRRIGYATDLGRVPVQLLAAFEALDILAIESNYDPQMQLTSNRPGFLKHRIMGGCGHLSNAQALAAVRQILDRADASRHQLPSRIVLLHRSRECNCPKLLRSLFVADVRIMPRLVLAEQYERTEWLRPMMMEPQRGEQLLLSWDNGPAASIIR